MPKFSIISIAKRETELENLLKALAAQTFRDFEFVTSTCGTIPEAWNDAISRARGDYIIFIESDSFPLNNQWLEEISRIAEKGAVLKGIEINPTDLNLCNIVADASVIKAERFDTNFSICEDTELFARLRSKGVKLATVMSFPAVHSPTLTWQKTMSRSFIRGVYFAKIFYLYGRENVDDINKRRLRRNYVNPVAERVRVITENVLTLLGEFVGLIYCLPALMERRSRRKKQS
jgi:glycosyltransferase involved in cell wall biosynthesis